MYNDIGTYFCVTIIYKYFISNGIVFVKVVLFHRETGTVYPYRWSEYRFPSLYLNFDNNRLFVFIKYIEKRRTTIWENQKLLKNMKKSM